VNAILPRTIFLSPGLSYIFLSWNPSRSFPFKKASKCVPSSAPALTKPPPPTQDVLIYVFCNLSQKQCYSPTQYKLQSCIFKNTTARASNLGVPTRLAVSARQCCQNTFSQQVVNGRHTALQTDTFPFLFPFKRIYARPHCSISLRFLFLSRRRDFHFHKTFCL
jgi:hypothetical protein